MQRWRVGQVSVARVPEMEVAFPRAIFLPESEAQVDLLQGAWLDPYFADGRETLRMSIHALVVDTPDRRILVDTCFGNDKPREVFGAMLQTRFLEEMTAAGFPPESVDVVLCTHLHADHVGWNTRLVDGRWEPTFPKARYLFGRAEYEDTRANPSSVDQVTMMADSIDPLFEAGLVDLVETDHQVDAAVRLVLTPGHTLGHVSVVIDSDGARGVITGDMIHHPCQFCGPQWRTFNDVDKDQGGATRQSHLARWADDGRLVIGTHFAAPTAGRVSRDGGAYRFDADDA